MKKRILMIEDTEDNRQILRDLFATTGFHTIHEIHWYIWQEED